MGFDNCSGAAWSVVQVIRPWKTLTIFLILVSTQKHKRGYQKKLPNGKKIIKMQKSCQIVLFSSL